MFLKIFAKFSLMFLIKKTMRMFNLGRHCCLWCKITSQQIQVPLEIRNKSEKRTFVGLEEDLTKFQQKGYILKEAKNCNNVIHKPFFNIPLQQVAIPGLHITLGIYLKLFNTLESFCHSLDIEIAVILAKKGDKIDTNYGDYIEQLKTIR